MHRFCILVLSLMICAVTGCANQNSSSSVGESVPPPTSTELAARLEAAHGIQNVGDRDSALVKLAKVAAATGDSTASLSAINAISSTNIRDNAAAEAAIVLARASKSADASRIANLISGNSLRDKTLATIAKGE